MQPLIVCLVYFFAIGFATWIYIREAPSLGVTIFAFLLIAIVVVLFTIAICLGSRDQQSRRVEAVDIETDFIVNTSSHQLPSDDHNDDDDNYNRYR